MKAKALFTYCKANGISFLPTWVRHMLLRLSTKQNIIAGRYVSIGVRPIVSGRLMIGMDDSILSMPKTRTWLKNAGELICKGMVDIHRGCRIEVAEGARLVLDNCFVNNNCLILCQHGISIGADTAIGWNTQICDEDYHGVIHCERDVLRGGGRYS